MNTQETAAPIIPAGPSAGAADYVIITPAHNEAAYIEKTIISVVAQTIRPLKWVIVNDSSTDRTPEIVKHYSNEHGFIQLLNIERDGGRHFANKVRAFNCGLTELSHLNYEYIGNLDADIFVQDHYYETILSGFKCDAKLGIAGGMVYTKMGDKFVTEDGTLDSIGGAVQLFRRRCFQDIGGYLPLPYGGEDAAAEITARMKGWKVRKDPALKVFENRRTGSGEPNRIGARVREGQRMHSLGYDPAFFFMRCLFRATDSPCIIGSIATLLGYADSLFYRRPVVLSEKVASYLKKEQRGRLKRLPLTLLGS
ncbi:MAG: glycosyltransferase family A protein [Verrucomicrobiota bacterium]